MMFGLFSTSCVQAVIDAGGIPAMLACLGQVDRHSLKRDILIALSNIAAGTCEQVDALLQAGELHALVTHHLVCVGKFYGVTLAWLHDACFVPAQ